ncbi:hypothetical protein [Photorhabdus laumondii]
MNNENSVIDGMQFSNGRWLASNISPSRHSHDNGSSLKPGSGDGGGGDMLEARVARLESDVEHIKASMSDMKADLKSVTGDVSSMKTDAAVIMQKLDGISSVLSKVPTDDKLNVKFEMINTKISEVKSEVTLQEAKTESKIKDARLHIILWILGLPSLAFALYHAYLLL